MAMRYLLVFTRQAFEQHPYKSVSVTILLLLLAYIIVNEIIRANARIPRLGGPPGLPLIGNLWAIRKDAAEQYRKWSQKYGGVYQVMLGNVPVVVINSAKSARGIFGHNTQTLSSRPEFYTFHKILSDTAGTTIGTTPYSESLKRRRKAAASALNRPSVATYVPLLDVETRDFVSELLTYGQGGATAIDPVPMIQRMALSMSVTLNWGRRIGTQDDDGLFAEIAEVEGEIARFRSTADNLQDYIPLLRWNPFSGHSTKARAVRDRRDGYLKMLNDDLDKRIAEGTHQPCIQAKVIVDEDAAKLDRAELMSVSLTMLSGGLDTVTAVVAWTIALLVNRPDVQEKAAQEINKTFGTNQPLCDENDDQRCAYIAALVRESLRYFTILRLALPRATVHDILYHGTVIPKGAVVFLNAWACNMDEEVWSDPEVFRPERWLERPDAPLFTYGLGYRMCAGALLANRELYMLCMRLVNSFRIEKFDEVNSHPVSGNTDPKGLVAVPARYRAKFVPRDIESLQKALSVFEEERSESSAMSLEA